MQKSISLFLLLGVGVVLIASSTPDLFAGQSYADDLIKVAEQQKLYNDHYWHILLHYRKTGLGVKSLIDDPRFFLSQEGAHNPKAELQATLSAFFRAPDEPANPPVCRFIARYAWLKEKLQLDESKLPVSECAKFNKTIAVIKPKSAALVFPASYMNNPASMFLVRAFHPAFVRARAQQDWLRPVPAPRYP